MMAMLQSDGTGGGGIQSLTNPRSVMSGAPCLSLGYSHGDFLSSAQVLSLALLLLSCPINSTPWTRHTVHGKATLQLCARCSPSPSSP